MKSNSDNVKKWRKNGGNQKQNELYRKLRDKYNVPSTQALRMKYWSTDRIKGYLVQNGYIELGEL